MQCRHSSRRVEARYRLHQVKSHSEDLIVVTGRDETRVGDIARSQRRKNARFASHRVVAILAQMARRSPQNVVAASTSEPEKDVLCATGQERLFFKWSRSQPTFVHPLPKPGNVNCIAPALLI